MARIRKCLVLVIILIMALACSKQPEETAVEQPAESVVEDSTFLPETPAPETEEYYFGLIRKGPSWTPDKTAEIARLQEAHLARIGHLADSGVLALAGPFSENYDNPDLRGLFLYAVDSMSQARRLADSDPMVQAGRLVVDLFYLEAPKVRYPTNYEMQSYLFGFIFQGGAFGKFGTPDFWELAYQQREAAAEHPDSCRIALAGYCADERNSLKLYGIIVYDSQSLPAVGRVQSYMPGLRDQFFMVRVFEWYGPSGLTGF